MARARMQVNQRTRRKEEKENGTKIGTRKTEER